MIVVSDGVLGVPRACVIVGEGEISGSGRRTLLKNGGQEVFRIA
jgi:hypothetical protein